MLADAHISSLGYLWFEIGRLMGLTVQSIKPKQLSRVAPLEWTTSAYVAIKGGFKIPWFHHVTLCR